MPPCITGLGALCGCNDCKIRLLQPVILPHLPAEVWARILYFLGVTIVLKTDSHKKPAKAAAPVPAILAAPAPEDKPRKRRKVDDTSA